MEKFELEQLELSSSMRVSNLIIPLSNFLVWIVQPSGCHRIDAFGGKATRRVPTPLGSTSPFSELLARGHADMASKGIRIKTIG